VKVSCNSAYLLYWSGIWKNAFWAAYTQQQQQTNKPKISRF